MGLPYVMLPVVGALRDELLVWTERHVPDAALTDKGRETFPHLTVFYGLPNDHEVAEAALLAATRGLRTVKTEIKYAGYFQHSDKAVLILNCTAGSLQHIVTSLATRFRKPYRLNAHITLAYIKKGRNVSTSGLMRFVGRTVEADHLIYVDADKQHKEFYLA